MSQIYKIIYLILHLCVVLFYFYLIVSICNQNYDIYFFMIKYMDLL